MVSIRLATVFAMAFIGLMASAQAAPKSPSATKRELLADISELTLKCVVRPYVINARGEQELHPLRSDCPEIQSSDARHATIQIEDKTYAAQLFDSQDADEGDLDDLLIYWHRRMVAKRHNVAAFDEIFIALAGGKDDFRMVRE